MRTDTSDTEWVMGFYPTQHGAEEAIRAALTQGVPKNDVSILCPPDIRRSTIAGIGVTPRHPERKWIGIGAAIGFLLGSVGIWLVYGGLFQNVAMELAAGFIRGMGGAVIGGFFGLVASGFDSSLNSFYEGRAAKNEIVVAIRCHLGDRRCLRRAKKVIRASGQRPLDLPPMTH